VGLLGRLDEGRREIEDAGRVAQADGELELELCVIDYRCEIAELAGDANVAFEQAQRSIEYAARFEGTFWEPMSSAYLCRAHLLAGRLEDARAEYERWDQLVREFGLEESAITLQALPWMAGLQRRLGELERALELARAAVEQTRAGGHRLYGVPAELELARVLLELEGPSSQAFAQARIDAAALIEKTGARAYAPWLNELDAECARRLGDGDA
jgi:hypothetical protein